MAAAVMRDATAGVAHMIRIRAKFANCQQTPKRQRVTNWVGGAEPGLKIRTSVACPKYRTIVCPLEIFLKLLAISILQINCWPGTPPAL